MTEDETRTWLRARVDVSRETFARLEEFVAAILAEADLQNLISERDRGAIWHRHVIDSAQLLDHAQDGDWIDLGSGSGFPGIVIAILRPDPVVLTEQRAKRVAFLSAVVDRLALSNVTVFQGRVERYEGPPARNISARAFAPAPRLIESAIHLSDKNTRWVLPKGRSAAIELEALRQTWQGRFELHRSVTDPDSAIIVATGVSRRTRP